MGIWDTNQPTIVYTVVFKKPSSLEKFLNPKIEPEDTSLSRSKEFQNIARTIDNVIEEMIAITKQCALLGEGKRKKGFEFISMEIGGKKITEAKPRKNELVPYGAKVYEVTPTRPSIIPETKVWFYPHFDLDDIYKMLLLGYVNNVRCYRGIREGIIDRYSTNWADQVRDYDFTTEHNTLIEVQFCYVPTAVISHRKLFPKEAKKLERGDPFDLVVDFLIYLNLSNPLRDNEKEILKKILEVLIREKDDLMKKTKSNIVLKMELDKVLRIRRIEKGGL